MAKEADVYVKRGLLCTWRMYMAKRGRLRLASKYVRRLSIFAAVNPQCARVKVGESFSRFVGFTAILSVWLEGHGPTPPVFMKGSDKAFSAVHCRIGQTPQHHSLPPEGGGIDAHVLWLNEQLLVETLDVDGIPHLRGREPAARSLSLARSLGSLCEVHSRPLSLCTRAHTHSLTSTLPHTERETYRHKERERERERDVCKYV